MKKNYQRFSIVFFLILFTFGAIGCGSKKIHYDNKLDITALEAIELSDDLEALNFPHEIRTTLSVVFDMEELKSNGIAQIIRYNKGKYYSVTHLKGGKYLFMLYDTNNGITHLVDSFLVSALGDKALFNNIPKGMNRAEILQMDPSSYVFEERSYHRFNDKSILKIIYTLEDSQYLVSDFEFLEDQVSVLDYLIAKDLEKIQ